MPPKRKAAASGDNTGSKQTRKRKRLTEAQKLDIEFGIGIGRKPAPLSPRRKIAKDVLSLAKINEEQRTLYNANATNSPLLRLPAELRNRIWELVLGAGHTIHIWGPERRSRQTADGRQLCRSTCRRILTEEEDADNIKSDYGITKQLGYHARHSMCRHIVGGEKNRKKQDDEGGMNLSVLETCRQIHEEAALIPFQENTFSFNWILDLEAFVTHLIPTQVEAVQHLSFVYHFFHSDADFENLLRDKLRGLKSLVFYVQSHGGHLPMSGIDAGLFERDFNYRLGVEECLLRFQRFPVESVKIAAYNSPGRIVQQEYEPGNLSNELLLRWTLDMEEKLMADWKEA